jgi:hypothetical protein
MDLLRSCSSQLIRFVKGDPTQTALATWYRCKPGAKAFPGIHSFGSPVWDQERNLETQIGFQATSARTYYDGRRKNTSDGTNFAGPAKFFVEGADSPALLLRGVNDTPSDCLRRPLGIAKGGQAATKFFDACVGKEVPYGWRATGSATVGGKPVAFDVPLLWNPADFYFGSVLYYNGSWQATFKVAGITTVLVLGCYHVTGYPSCFWYSLPTETGVAGLPGSSSWAVSLAQAFAPAAFDFYKNGYIPVTGAAWTVAPEKG